MTLIDTRTSRIRFETLVGRQAIVTTDHGEHTGTLEMPGRFSGGQMVVRFADGRWAHAGVTIHLVD